MLDKKKNFTEMILIRFSFSNYEYNIEKFFNIFIYNNFLNKIKKIYEKYFPFDFYKTFNLIDIYYKNEIIYIKFNILNTKIDIKEKEFLTKEKEERLFKNFILDITKFIKKIEKIDNEIYFNIKEFHNINLFIDIERKIKFEKFINMLKLDEIKENSDFSFNIIGNKFKIWNFKRLKNNFKLIRLDDNIKLKNEVINVERELGIEVKKSNKLIKISSIKGILIKENKNSYVIITDFYIKDKNNKFIISLTEIYKDNYNDKFINVEINNKRLEVDMSFNINDVNEFIKLLLLNLIKKKRILFKKTKIWKMVDDIKLISLII